MPNQFTVKTWPCRNCGKELNETEYHNNTLYCLLCRKIRERKKNQAKYDKRRNTIQHQNCMMCGGQLIDPKTGKRRPKFCSVKCDQKFHWLTHKPHHPPKKCLICSKIFVGIKNQKYCSVYCYAQSLTAYWRHRREQRKLIKVVAR